MKYYLVFSLVLFSCGRLGEPDYLVPKRLDSRAGDGNFKQIRSLVVWGDRILFLDKGLKHLGFLSPNDMGVSTFSNEGQGPGEMELPATHFANPWVESDTICFVHSGGAKQDRFDSTGNALISTRWHNPGVLLWQNKSVSLSIEHQKFIWAHSGQFNEIPFGFDDRVILWAAIQGNKIFVCPRALVNHKNLPFWLFQQDQGFVLKGEIPVRLQLKPEEMPDLPEGMVFTPDAIYGLASNLDGFWITERPFKPGPFQYVHAVDLNGNVQTFEIKVNTDVPLQDVMVKFGDKWVGFDTVTESFYVFTL